MDNDKRVLMHQPTHLAGVAVPGHDGGDQDGSCVHPVVIRVPERDAEYLEDVEWRENLFNHEDS